MTALTPGLYRATVDGVPDVIVMVDVAGMGHLQRSLACDTWHAHSADITDARLLIILDLAGLNVAEVIESLREDRHDVIAAQIEAQTKPRIPEPGRWGVVKAGCSRWPTVDPLEWVRRGEAWQSIGSSIAYWTELTDPVLIRDGIQ